MKKIVWRISTLLGVGVASLLSLFSNTACHIIGGGRVEYGTPHADFEHKIKVQSPSADPIEGLEVDLVQKVEEKGEVSYQSEALLGTTNGSGMLFIRDGIFAPDQPSYIRITDKDGDLNGAWETKIEPVEISRLDVQIITMTPQKSKGEAPNKK